MGWIKYKDARALADKWVEIASGGTADILEECTITRPYGWVFFWQSKRYIETRDPMDSLLGNAPIIVDRVNFELLGTGTADPIEHYLKEYEATIPPFRLTMTPEYPPGRGATKPEKHEKDEAGTPDET
jgi:hypothetical protein